MAIDKQANLWVSTLTKGLFVYHSTSQKAERIDIAALPAGEAYGSDTEAVGADAFFWTSTPYNVVTAYMYKLYFDEDYLYIDHEEKEYAYSVRCVRN